MPFGAFGSPYPIRDGMPVNSQPVMNDNDFNNAWQSSMPEQYIWQELAGQRQYGDQGAQSYIGQIDNANMDSIAQGAGTSRESLSGVEAYLRGMGLTGSWDGGRIVTGTDAYSPLNVHMGASHKVNTGQINPDFTAAQAAWGRARDARQQNQNRMQSAYDKNQLGNSAVGGVLPADYNSSSYGQISGAANTGSTGGLGGSGGMTQAGGAYGGGAGAYNPTPFLPGTMGESPWGGF